MRILVLSKRRYMGKDLLDDQYGRYFEIPEELVKRGHEVKGIALSYNAKHTASVTTGLVDWHSIDALPFPPLSLVRYLALIRRTVRDFRPDVIWAGSDALHGIIGAAASCIYQIPLVIDLYDNYEAYGLTRLPGIRPLFIHSCRRANALTVVGNRLKSYVAGNYNKGISSIYVLENAIRKDLFRKTDKLTARKTLGLPESAKLIGTAGALTTDRGIEVLFDAFLDIAMNHEDVHLIVAGQRDGVIGQYKHARIIDLGMLPLESVPLVFNALDVAVICNKRSSFGEYCFPQKFYEIAACGTPVVSADVGEMHDILTDSKELLFRAESKIELEKALLRQLDKPTPFLGGETPTWSTRALALEGIFNSLK